MLFSYGFLGSDMDHARALFLPLSVPDDDPLKSAKLAVTDCAPGFRLSKTATDDQVRIDCEFVWLICVNEEDGLHFQIAQTTDGERELQATWGDEPLGDVSNLRARLEVHPLWEIFQLRAVAIVQQKVGQTLGLLYEAADMEPKNIANVESIREGPKSLAWKLRRLETEFLEGAYEDLEHQVGCDSDQSLLVLSLMCH